VSHRNDISWPDKEVRLPELDMLRLAGQLRRAQHYKGAILILLQLRPLVRAVSAPYIGEVADRQFLATSFSGNGISQCYARFFMLSRIS
jgi:hypothetical protein